MMPKIRRTGFHVQTDKGAELSLTSIFQMLAFILLVLKVKFKILIKI